MRECDASGIAICRALGLDPANVFEIELYWAPGEPPTMYVAMRPNEGVVAEIVRLRWRAVSE